MLLNWNAELEVADSPTCNMDMVRIWTWPTGTLITDIIGVRFYYKLYPSRSWVQDCYYLYKQTSKPRARQMLVWAATQTPQAGGGTNTATLSEAFSPVTPGRKQSVSDLTRIYLGGGESSANQIETRFWDQFSCGINLNSGLNIVHSRFLLFFLDGRGERL